MVGERRMSVCRICGHDKSEHSFDLRTGLTSCNCGECSCHDFEKVGERIGVTKRHGY